MLEVLQIEVWPPWIRSVVPAHPIVAQFVMFLKPFLKETTAAMKGVHGLQQSLGMCIQMKGSLILLYAKLGSLNLPC